MNAVYSEKFRAWADLWHKAEKQNDAEAQYIIASLYYSTDKKESCVKAAELLRRSAKNKYTDAMFALGTLYENGKGVRKNHKLAIKWYKAAESNISYDLDKYHDPLSHAEEAALKRYFTDDGYREFIDELIESEEAGKDDTFKYDRKAAEKGDAKAQNSLGHRYYYGHGTVKDIHQAGYWYLKSAEQGYEAGMIHRAEFCEREKNYAEAAKWYRKYTVLRINWRNERLGLVEQ